MNLGVVMLSMSTVVLAASSAYLARELVTERDRNAALEAPAVADASVVANGSDVKIPPAPAAPTQSMTSADPAAAANRASPAPIPATREEARARERELSRPGATDFLSHYDNPQTRQALVDAQLDRQRRDFALLRPKLELDADRWERLVRLLAEEDVGRQALSARCLIDEACVRPKFGAYSREQQQAVIDLIGAKNADKLITFRGHLTQASSLARFQARLGPKLELSSVQIDELANALADEARRTRREIESHGHASGSYSSRYGTVVFSLDTDTLEKRMASAAESVDRMRDRAGTLLSGERLTIFNQSQDDSLLIFRSFARVGILLRAQGYEP